ncbi:hypothetical protein [Methanococcus voltae]|uniref:Uncharacterized protein n=1 Tax=Methanococcus voltae (strain ATCC BAA-1334 / A3) TaxID=456320 RepID=D7DSC7_METV3|nr:hypothetical protein [Methanococcus voltae]MCS3901563.1 hypothetical protein [Methanococcus voltae]
MNSKKSLKVIIKKGPANEVLRIEDSKVNGAKKEQKSKKDKHVRVLHYINVSY